MQSNQVAEMAVIDRGVYCDRDPYQHLRVDQLKWIRMTAKQRELHLRKVAVTAVVGPLDGIADLAPPTSDFSPLSIRPEEAKLEHVPLETVRGMWMKAKDLLTTPGAVVNGPRLSGTDPQTVIVASKSCAKPRVITHKSLSCESTCLNWAAIRICSHTVAAAHFCSELGTFLQKYQKKKCSPNLTRLARIGMPKGTGKKGEKPPHKRRCAETVHTFTPMSSAASTSSLPPSGHNDSMWSQPSFSGQTGYPGSLPGCERTFFDTQYSPGYQSLPSFSGHESSPSPCLYPMLPPYGYSYPTVNQSQNSISALTQSQSVCFPRYASPCRPPQLRDQLNPCTLKFVCGNIRICQSCRDSLRSTDGSLRSPPLDLCVSHLGKRQYWNSTSNTWCVPSRSTNSHYCARVVCVQFAFPTFIPSALVVPEEVRVKLGDVHKDYLSMEFSLAFH